MTDKKCGLVCSATRSLSMSLQEAVAHCKYMLGAWLGAGWKLTTIDEFRTLIMGCLGTELDGQRPPKEASGLENGCLGSGWLFSKWAGRTCGWGPGPKGPFVDETSYYGYYHYWSSTQAPWSPSSAFDVDFDLGMIGEYKVRWGLWVWCV